MFKRHIQLSNCQITKNHFNTGNWSSTNFSISPRNERQIVKSLIVEKAYRVLAAGETKKTGRKGRLPYLSNCAFDFARKPSLSLYTLVRLQPWLNGCGPVLRLHLRITEPVAREAVKQSYKNKEREKDTIVTICVITIIVKSGLLNTSRV